MHLSPVKLHLNPLQRQHSLTRGSRLQWEKNESQKFNGCPILSQAIGQEKLRTVFVFALAHLEGPPQAFAGYNSKFK